MKRETKTESQAIDEEMLLVVLRQEEMDSATFYQSEIAREQAIAADRYFARPYGDGSEVPNRSQVCTHDIQDAINWALPPMLRTFTQAEDLISVDDDGLDDGDETLTDAATYLHHVFFKDNAGEQVIHDFLFDGLLQKIGVARTSWEPAEPRPPEVWEGLTVEQVLKLKADRRYRILAAVIDGEVDHEDTDVPAPQTPAQQLPPPGGPTEGPAPGLMGDPRQPQPGLMPEQQPEMLQPQGPEPTFTVQVQRIETGRARVEVIPPEEFRIARRARSIEEAPYHGWRFEEYLANLKRLHPDKAMELDDDTGGIEVAVGLDAFYDERLTARFPDELDNGVARIAKEAERRRVVVNIEYVWGDFDGDNVVELRRIKRSGSVILENDIVTESEFSTWSPIRVSHRAIGLSVADTLIDIQRIRTALTRKAMDSLTQGLAPRLAIDKRALANDPSLIDRLLDHEVGDVLPVEGEPGKVLLPLVTPDVSASAFQAIEYWDRRSEEASGVNRHAMGIQPQAITDTAKGIDNLQSAANQRIEQYARWAANGLEQVLGKMLRTLIRHQDQARIVKINGRRMEIDPRRWSDDMTVSVHIGMAAENRERKMQFLSLIAAKQEAIMTQAGIDNPLCGPKEYRNTLSQLIMAMGMKSATPYFKDVPDNWQPPPAQPDPKVAAEQAKLQIAQQKAQSDQQLAQQKLTSDAQLKQAEFQRDLQLQASRLDSDRQAAAAELQHKAEMSRAQLAADTQAQAVKAETERQMQAAKLESEARIRAQQLQTETILAQRKLEAETALAREKMAAEMQLARWKAGQDVRVARERNAGRRVKVNGSASVPDEDLSTGVRFGGQVG